MKTWILISTFLFGMTVWAGPQKHTHQPKISLFESVEAVKKFLKGETKYKYSDRILTSIKLHYFDSHPRKGEAWVYSFSHKKPTLGNDLSIFHYTDGTIVEFHHGP